MSLADYAVCPAVLRVREAEVNGRILITTLGDPKAVTPTELDSLYALRWNIEMDWRTIAVTMATIEKKIATYLLAYNLVRWGMASAAWLRDALPR